MIINSAKYRHCIIAVIIAFFAMAASAETASSGKVKIEYEPTVDGGIKVINVWNKSDLKIHLYINNEMITVNANSSAQPNRYTKGRVSFSYPSKNGATLWEPLPVEEVVKEIEPESEEDSHDVIEAENDDDKKITAIPADDIVLRRKVKAVADNFNFVSQLNNDPFFSQDAINLYVKKIDILYTGLEASANKHQFIIDHDINQILEQSKLELDQKKADIPRMAKNLVTAAKIDDANQASTVSLIVDALTSRLTSRENAYDKLYGLVTKIEDTDGSSLPGSKENIINYGIVGTIILLVLILTVVTVRKKSRKKKISGATASSTKAAQQADGENSPAIVVRRRTTSILKKQCIDDVVDNPAYMVINTFDFTPDSAVKKIYIKNSCIKEVYNLYADDLRNTDKPKEDGCMVLGRWVHNESDNTYDISLEEVVFPGDDAVFKEYELNFGGKIKLRVAEKLRKLRRDTNLQYDLVCWIHSHPGLGVFFSNSDDNVQMQLKHSQHPNFLIAFVVDILTSDQETGIFTFRRDGSMNSKGDITKMYSLEEMYKWALQSERQSFSPDNCFNVLRNACLKMPACNGVEMNNSSIIDLTQIIIDPATGIVGWVIGTTIDGKAGVEFIVSGITKASEKPKTGVIGCLINEVHMSLPTIQRLVSHESGNLSFVMVYSSKQLSLTTIPVINGVLLTDERFYGDVNIDDLKIWTRRKR